MKIEVYNQKGKAIGQVELPDGIFNLTVNPDLIHQAIVAQQANARKVIAHTKDRSERRGGGVKPWRQKGTGRARHGSIRSPIWRKGGVTFGPTKERNYSKKINKKMKQKALFMALSAKLKDKEMVILDKLELDQPKTKAISQVLSDLGKGLKREIKSALLVAPQTEKKIILASRNLPKTKVIRADSLNSLDILKYQNLILLKDSIKVIQETYLKRQTKNQESKIKKAS